MRECDGSGCESRELPLFSDIAKGEPDFGVLTGDNSLSEKSSSSESAEALVGKEASFSLSEVFSELIRDNSEGKEEDEEEVGN